MDEAQSLPASRTYLHEMANGTLVEYRRVFRVKDILDMEHRQLRKDGTPYDGEWFPVTDNHLLWIQKQESDIVDQLDFELPL